jgi:hydrocephalus-inducing protein
LRSQFFSLDFDRQYLEEEEILRKVPIFQAEGLGYKEMTLLPLRTPSGGLQRDVLSAWEAICAQEVQRRKEAEKASMEQQQGDAAEEGAEPVGDSTAEQPGDGLAAEPASGEAAESAEVGKLVPLRPAEPDLPGVNIVVFAHPQAGGPRVALGLAKQHSAGLVNIKQLVRDRLSEAGIAQYMEKVESEEEDEPPKLVPVAGKYVLKEVAQLSASAKELQELFFPPIPPPEQDEVPEPAGEEGEEGGEGGEGDAKAEPPEPEPRVEEVADGWLTKELLAKFIGERISLLDCVRGVVFEGLECEHLPDPPAVLQAIELALSGKKLNLVLVSYKAQEAAAGDENAKPEQDDAAAEPEESAAEAVENLSDHTASDNEEVAEIDVPDARKSEVDAEQDLGPEEEFTAEELKSLIERYEEVLPGVVAVFEPPKPEGEEDPAAEGAAETPPPPPEQSSSKHVVRVQREDQQQPIKDLLRAVSSELPQPQPMPGLPRKLAILDPYVREIVVYPSQRLDRRHVRNFYILTPIPKESPPPAEAENPGEEESKPEGEGGDEAPVEAEGPKHSTQTRWTIPARGSLQLLVRMKAEDTGKCEALLSFEVSGGGAAMRGREFFLPVRGMCAYPQISQSYQSIYYRKIKTRAEGQIVSKQYIVSKNVFEFGPLLVGKSKEDYMTKYPENQEKFRITNNGLFDLHIDFCFKDDQEGKVFVVDPEFLDLPMDETQDITVYAFTEEEGDFSDKLICNIKNNPEPFEINLSCAGSVPNIVTDIEPAMDEEGNPIEGPPKVEFQRLLLRRKDTRVVTIKNTSLLPAKWRLQNVSEEEGFNCGKELSILPTEGTLQPAQSQEITIGFHALEKAVLEKNVTLEWVDVDNLLSEPKSLEFSILAEAYEIDFTFVFPAEGEEVLDYGILKVADGGEQTLTITNNGKYEVGYRFDFARPKRSAIKKFLKVETVDEGEYQGKPNGVLGPDASAEIKVIFDSKPFPGEEEVSFKDNTDLRCYVSELLTGEEILNNPIKVSVRSVFSKYRVLPQKGISFGALTYDTQKTRTFDIVNQGEFDFSFEIKCITSLVRSRPGTSMGRPSLESREEGEATPDGGIKFGSFTVTPASGSVQPNGEKQTVTVLFEAAGQAIFSEVLGIQVSERDPAADPNGMAYEVSGESCVPGILVADFLQIFEEAAVLRKPPADPNQLLASTFVEEERVFHFGPRLVDSRAEVRVKIVNPTKVAVTVDLAMAAKGAEPVAFEVVEAQLAIPMHEHRYATVYFKPKGLLTYTATFEASVANGSDEQTNRLAFDVTGDGTLPRVVVREPALRNEAGQALVDFRRLLVGKVHVLPLHIVNEGILPATVRFSRPGPWPAPQDAREWVDGPACFSFSGRGAEVFLNSKEERRFEVTFRPKAAGDFRGSLEMAVLKNEFERNIVELKGEGYTRDVAFESMSDGTDDTLNFGQVPVGVPKELSFAISNTSGKVFRFSFPSDPAFSFVPSVGHLHPRGTKAVVATFLAGRSASFSELLLSVSLAQIEYTEEPREWDNGMKDVEWVPDDGATLSPVEETLDSSALLNQSYPIPPVSPRDGRKGRRRARKVTRTKPEPAHRPVLVGDPPEEGGEDTRQAAEDAVDLKATAEADYLRYAYVVTGEGGDPEDAAALPGLVFAETMMYRTRAHAFRFRNASRSRMEVAWRVCGPDGEEDDSPEAPFSVEPQAGSLGPGEAQDVVVRFSPTEADEYRRKLVGFIPHLGTRAARPPTPAGDEAEPEGEPPPEPQAQPEVLLLGRSRRPLCHFELAESDWLSGGRRPPTLATPNGAAVDPGSRCVEFESLGTQVRNTKRFFVMNPTNVSYKFRWECADGTGAAVSHVASAFRCVHREGVVLSGKKSEMVFEYTPESDMLIESFWRFEIPEYSISVPFILVGHVKEPNVYLDKTFCNFGSLLVHHKATHAIKLVNREHIPFAFAFDGRTFGADEDPPIVRIEPASGTVAPESELAITVQFMPKLEKTYNFNAVCHVKKKATRLAVNVKGEGFDTHCHVAMEDERGAAQAVPGQTLPVDFGEVHVNETRVKTVSLLNTGKYPIEFEWRTAKSRMLTIKPELGSVGRGERADVKIAFHPLTESRLAEHLATLQVVNGPRFLFSISAAGRKPLLHFSFLAMDFGPCFLHRQGAQPATATLRVTNEDAHDIGYVVLFDNLPHLELVAPPTNLAPGQSESVLITFMPREARAYSDLVSFEINGLYRVNVEVTGSGHDCDVALANPAHFNFPLGAVKVGSVLERRIRVRNGSAVTAACSVEASAERLLAWDLRVRPAAFTLRPREAADLELTYAPSRRMAAFAEELVLEVAGHARALSVLNGSAVGIELKLDSDMLFFGAVVAHSRTVRRVQLENVGDIGTKWRLSPAAFLPNFSVEPTEGFLNPHDAVTLDVAFHPAAVSDDVRRDNLPVYVDGADPLSLTLTGICVSQEPEEEAVAFATAVRTPVTVPIPPIRNPTDLPWRLRPVVRHDFWSGPELLEVPPGGEAAYPLTYRPLAMTAGDGVPPLAGGGERPERHEGSVFIPKPDGTAAMHRLVGTAGPPLLEAPEVVREVPCKAWHTEHLAVRNWLGRPQRFAVRADPPPEGTTRLAVAPYMDVPASSERSLAVKFHTYVEGSTRARLTLTNEESGEYLFFDVEFAAGPAPVLGRYELATAVRQEKELRIELANPLDAPVAVRAECDSAEVAVEPRYELRARGETACRVVYRPLLPSEGETATVRFSSPELGDFVYELRLRAAPAGTERQMQFKAPLGTTARQTFRFRHLLPAGCAYDCAVDKDVFSVPAQVAAPGAPDGKGAEVEVEVAFDPDAVGETAARLTVSSDAGGEYVCLLHGHGQPPRAQGPIEVPGRASVDFRNPFAEARSFAVAVDSDAFSAVARLDGVAPRSAIPISVAYRAPAPGVSLPGKLTVTCDGCPPWIYYLKGV